MGRSATDLEDAARRRTARPLERDLESVLVDLASEFPRSRSLVERRAGGQKRLPTATGEDPARSAALEPAPDSEKGARPAGVAARPPSAPTSPEPGATAPSIGAAHPPEPGHSILLAPGGPAGPRRPTRYGLSVGFEDPPEASALGRLVESTVLVNTAHPAYLRAVASRAEGYHAALTVAMALADVAVEPADRQRFVTVFLARWGEALGRDRRRRTPTRRPGAAARG